MKISIVSPCLNESKNLKIFSEKILTLLNSNKIEGELIIVDDNSIDGTDKILKNLSSKYDNFKFLIRKNKSKDLTQSCFEGIKTSKYENVLIMDCDLQHRPEDAINLINEYKTYKFDFVIGVRNLNDKNLGLNFFRRISSLLVIFFVNLFLTKITSDPMSGFFIFKKKLFSKDNHYFGKGFKILMDLIYNSKVKIRSKDFNITFDKRQNNKSKMNLKVLFYIIKFIILVFIKKKLIF